jgi:flagellar FliL protein
MADATTLDQDAEAAPPADAAPSKFGLKLGKKQILLFVLPGVLVLLLGVAGFLYYHGTFDSLLGRKPAVEVAPPKPLVFYDLPDFLVNLNSGGRKSNFLKLSVSLQLENPEDQMKLQAVLPRIIDNCQIFLRELRIEDLSGSSGIYRLREEMLKRVNAVSPVKVDDVLFKEMLVQ